MVHAKDVTNLMNDTAQLVDAIAPTSFCDVISAGRCRFLGLSGCLLVVMI